MGISSSIDLMQESGSVPWHSVQDQDTQQTYVALYEFKPENTWGEQLSLNKGSRLRLISQNPTREWCQVEQVDGEDNGAGWVPRSYVAPESSLEAKDWFHGEVDRATAEFLVGSRDGTFLVRKGISQPGTWSLSVLINGSPSHFRILNDLQGKFYIDSNEKFSSLSRLIEHYQEEREGVRVWLRDPATKVKPPVYTFSPDDDDDEWEIDRNQLKDKEQVGEGSFGIVEKAKWKKFDVVVAIKRLRRQCFSLDQEEEFRTEAETMKAVKHPNLIQLLGISTTESPFLLISEFMSEGDLSEHLRMHDETSITWSVLLHMAVQVAMGMEYLEKRRIVHRDLAGRNCFVGEGNIVKVGDFGLSRFTHENEIYQGGADCKFPFKWTAPEGILEKTFTSKSDVWSFGILLWEIATLGKQVPYLDLSNLLLFTALQQGRRLEKPRTCPGELYQLMQDCWKMDPKKRPNFSQIRSKINAVCRLVKQLQKAIEFFRAVIDDNAFDSQG